MDNNDNNIGIQADLENAVSLKQKLQRSTELGYLIAFLNTTIKELKERMMRTRVYKKDSSNETKYLQDINYLPMTFINLYYPISLFLLYLDQVSSTITENGEKLHFCSETNHVNDPNDSDGSKGTLEIFYYFVEQISDEQLESYLSQYVNFKRITVKKIDKLCSDFGITDSKWTKDIADHEEHKKWLISVKEEIMTGDHVQPACNSFAVSAFQKHRNSFTIDRILQLQINMKIEMLKSVNAQITKIKDQYLEDTKTLRKRNDCLQDQLTEARPKRELRFVGLDEIEQLGGFDMRKVSIKVISDAKVPLDTKMINSNKHEAVQIRVRYEGVKDATTIDLDGFRNDTYRIRENERKLLLAFAWWGKNQKSNQKEIQTLLYKAASECVSHLNGMLREIFNTGFGAKFIDKSKAKLNFKIEVEDVRELDRVN